MIRPSRLRHAFARTALASGLVLALFGTSHSVAQPAAAPQPASTTAADPALWVVSDADSTIYLFGTVHVLRPETQWRSDKVDAAFAEADRVMFELSDPDDQAAVMPLIQQFGLAPDQPLSGRLTAEELAQLDAAAREIGLSAAQLDPMRPWLAALSLAMAPLEKAGYQPQSGVELVLKGQAEAAGKPITGLETIAQQVGFLANLPDDVQLDLLRSTLNDYAEAVTKLDAMVEAWASGDVDALDRAVVEDMRDQSEPLYQALLVRRNADWADQIETLLEGSGTTFIAVGAAHLVGEDSVQSMLEQRGVAVTRR